MSIRVIDCKATSLHLKEMLKEHGIKAKDVQLALGLNSIQAVYKWLSPDHKTVPSLDNLVQLSALLNCKIEDLLVIKEMSD